MNSKSKFTNPWMSGVMIFILAGFLVTGCTHSHSRTVTRETAAPAATTTTTAGTTAGTTTTTAAPATVVEEHTHVEERDYGLFGGVFHVVGEVLAFPFQLVADLFRFIF